MRTILQIENEKYQVKSLDKSRFRATDACMRCHYRGICWSSANPAPCHEFDNENVWPYLAYVTPKWSYMRTIVQIENEKYQVKPLEKSRFCANDACKRCHYRRDCRFGGKPAPCEKFDDKRLWTYLVRV